MVRMELGLDDFELNLTHRKWISAIFQFQKFGRKAVTKSSCIRFKSEGKRTIKLVKLEKSSFLAFEGAAMGRKLNF